VADVIVGQAKKWRADLIVIGTHGRRGVNRWMPVSDAEQVVRMTPVPVLLVRCDDIAAGPAATAVPVAESIPAAFATA